MSANIFIVEDERLVAEDIRISLESHGYSVAGIASSRDKAIEGIRKTSPNLVLMDIILKGPGDGIEAAALVRELFDIPVIYLTAHADQATLRRAKISEPFGYILKPFEERDLFSGIEMALYRHLVEKRLEEKERWLATILASITDGVIAADAMGVVKLVNAEAERIGGWARGELLDLDLGDVYRIRDSLSGCPVELPSLPNLIEDGAVWSSSQVLMLTCKDGSTRLIDQSVSPICDPAGTFSGSVVVFRAVHGGTNLSSARP